MEDKQIQAGIEQGFVPQFDDATKKALEFKRHKTNKKYNITGVLLDKNNNFAGYRMRFRHPNNNKYNPDGTLKLETGAKIGFYDERYGLYFGIKKQGPDASDEEAILKLPTIMLTPGGYTPVTAN